MPIGTLPGLAGGGMLISLVSTPSLLAAEVVSRAASTDTQASLERLAVTRDYSPLLLVLLAVPLIWGLVFAVDRWYRYVPPPPRIEGFPSEFAAAHELSLGEVHTLEALGKQLGLPTPILLYVTPQAWKPLLGRPEVDHLFDRLFGAELRSRLGA